MSVRSIVQHTIAIKILFDNRALPVDQVDSRSGKGAGVAGDFINPAGEVVPVAVCVYSGAAVLAERMLGAYDETVLDG